MEPDEEDSHTIFWIQTWRYNKQMHLSIFDPRLEPAHIYTAIRTIK